MAISPEWPDMVLPSPVFREEAGVSPAGAQNPGDIVTQLLAEYERRTEGVDDYTLIQAVMGTETVSYFEKEMVDGRPLFRLRTAGDFCAARSGYSSTAVGSIGVSPAGLAQSLRIARTAGGGSK